MKSNKLIFILLAVVAVIVVIALLKGGKNRATKVAVEKVEKRTIVETVAASGKIQPETEVIISSDVSGEIIEMPVKEGDRVKQGDLLVKIDPDLVESAMNRAEAALNTSKANLMGAKARLAQSESQFENAKASFERSEKLNKDQVISAAEFDQATANFEVAKADVEAAKESVQAAMFNVRSAEATLSEAMENLGRTSIYSPMDGYVTKLNLEKGERVVGTAQMAGTEIMNVADLSVMEVAVEVNENDIVRVTVGDTADIEVDAYLEEDFKGVVTEIANSANITGMSADQVTNFDVKIRMVKESYQSLIKNDTAKRSPFRPGMSATVDIRTMEAIDILTVPIQAVTTRIDTSISKEKDKKKRQTNEEETDEEEEQKECIFVIQDEKAQIIYVETGIQNTMHIELKTKLEEGTQVISGPYREISKKLEHGDEVEIVDKDQLFDRSSNGK